MFFIRWPAARSATDMLSIALSRARKRTDFLAGTADGIVVIIKNDTHLFHQTNLLFIVALEVTVRRRCLVRACERGINFREQVDDVLCRDRLGLRSGRTHLAIGGQKALVDNSRDGSGRKGC